MTLTLTFSEPTTLNNSWNAQMSLSADGLALSAGHMVYNSALGPDQSATFGFAGSHDGGFDPPSCSGN